MFVGHTHRPMHHVAGAGLIINPGSVGQPRDGNPTAAYATFDTETREVSFRRAEYHVAALQARLQVWDWEPTVIDILSRRNNGARCRWNSRSRTIFLNWTASGAALKATFGVFLPIFTQTPTSCRRSMTRSAMFPISMANSSSWRVRCASIAVCSIWQRA